jgi:hypothetical protein
LRHWVKTTATGGDTFFAPVLPKTDAVKTGVTVVVVEAQAIVAAHGRDPGGACFADGRRPAAARVEAWGLGGPELTGALLGPVTVDVRAELSEPRAVLILVAGLVGPNAEVRRRGHLADVVPRAVKIVVAWHATIDTRSCPSSLTGEAEGTIVALGDAITARGDPDAALPASPDLHALIVGRVGTSDART